MSEAPLEQRNAYRGRPARAWARLTLLSPHDRVRELAFLVDTGNPCAIVLDTSTMESMHWRDSISTESNFGRLVGGWLRVMIPGLAFDSKVLGYANDSVVDVVKRSDPSLAGLVGLPFLQMVEYGGDSEAFWLRSSAGQ